MFTLLKINTFDFKIIMMLPELARIKGIHPGAILKRELIQRGMKPIQLAATLNEHKQTISAIPPRFAMPTVFRFGESLAVVSDSGLGDGWGYVSAVRGTPEWSTIAARGGWKRLWMRSAVAPPGAWSWTGEFVVVGLLNWNEPTQNLSWTTAEIAFTA